MTRSLILSAACIALLATAPRVEAHSWYEPACCFGDGMSGDCQPIPASSVEVIPGVGYRVTLRPGDHGDVTREHVFVVEFGKERASGDNEWHACLWPREDTLRCLYRPPMGM